MAYFKPELYNPEAAGNKPVYTREDLARAWDIGRKAGWDDAVRSWDEEGPEDDGMYASNPYGESPDA